MSNIQHTQYSDRQANGDRTSEHMMITTYYVMPDGTTITHLTIEPSDLPPMPDVAIDSTSPSGAEARPEHREQLGKLHQVNHKGDL